MKRYAIDKTVFFLAAVILMLGLANRLAAAPSESDTAQLPLTGLDLDASVPTIKDVLRYDWARQITSHAAMERYLHALVKASPDRARLTRYGASYEKRGLYYLVISSPENLSKLDAIRRQNLKLADPRRTPQAEASQMVADMPAVVWLASSVHGNELSGTEAALLTAYHLLADQRPQTKAMLENLVVLIDPLQNPDGRERFVNVFRETHGVFANAHPRSTEHAERWPGGRFNHYLFDMNRDWFLQSQQETVFKVCAYLHWQPQVYVDVHEMGRNSSYFFVPPTDPVNPFMLANQEDWLHRFGQHQASWFDRFGFAYTTREIFDAFYPGYGSEWPTLQGGLGILWEQAGVRGLVIDRDDETKLAYRDAILHHYVSCLATLEIASERRGDLLSDFYQSRARGSQLAGDGPVSQFFLPLDARPNRTTQLAQLLRRNGVDLYRTTEPIKIKATDIRSGAKIERVIPANSFQVPVAQPAGRLVRVLLDRKVEMDEEYVQQQLKRKEDYLPDQIYDVTAWSLPLAFDVPCLATDEKMGAVDEPWDGQTETAVNLDEAKVAYLVSPTDGALKALGVWLQRKIRVHVTRREFTLNGRKHPPGTLIVKKVGNRATLHEAIEQATKRYHLDVVSADTGFVDEGAHFGGPYVQWVRPPEILLAVDRPASYSVGHTWHLFDQVLRYPTTRVSCRNLTRLDLDDFNVLVMPDGDYSDAYGMTKSFADRLRQWVREGGTLIVVDGAAVWAADEKIKLIPLKRVAKPLAASLDGSQSDKTGDDAKAASPKRWPDNVPGAFLRAELFEPHWSAFGCPKTMNIFFRGNVFFQPLQPEQGRDIVTFVADDSLLASGFCWPETKKLIGGKTYLSCKSIGSGYVVAFAGDPNYRAMYPSLQRLFINACFFGPGQ